MSSCIYEASILYVFGEGKQHTSYNGKTYLKHDDPKLSGSAEFRLPDASYAAFMTATGLDTALASLTGNGASFAAQSAGVRDFEGVLTIAAYLRTAGKTIPTNDALFASWKGTTVTAPAPPAWVQPGASNGYALDFIVTHPGGPWKSLYANNVWEPGSPGAPTWVSQAAPPATPQPWTQRTPGVDMYGVGPHPEGAAAIGILRVTNAGKKWKLLIGDQWGFAPSAWNGPPAVWLDEGAYP